MIPIVRLAGVSFAFACLAAPAAGQEAVRPPLAWFDPSAAVEPARVAERAMVSTAHPLASGAALSALSRGGNAVDAMVAAQLVLNVVEPQSSGIGGGCFVLYMAPGRDEPVVIDGRETAPGGVSGSLFLDESGEPMPYVPDRITGGHAVGVPGTLAAIHLAHARYGSLAWSSLADAAIRIAREGFPVSRRLAASLRTEAHRLEHFPEARRIFFDPAGRTLAEGYPLRQEALAATLELVASRGPDAFYRGEIAEDIVRSVTSSPVRPGAMSREDLEAYRAIERVPVRGRYRGHDVFGVGPPSSGGIAVIEILQILEGYELSKLRPGSPEHVHLLLEAGKLAFADRNRYVGDGDFVDVPTETLVSPAFAAERRRAIDTECAADAPLAAASVQSLESVHTTHFSIVDPDGGMVAVTSSIEQPFGSCLVVAGRGFLLNNELSDFDATPVDENGEPVANRVQPGKRPRSSMSPTLLSRDGTPWLALGSPGGSRIIGITAGAIVNVVDFGMDVQQAIDFPRALNRGRKGSELEVLYFDDPMLELRAGVSGTVAALRVLGHFIEPPPPGARAFGGVHAVRVLPGGRREGGADPRREGVALGF